MGGFNILVTGHNAHSERSGPVRCSVPKIPGTQMAALPGPLLLLCSAGIWCSRQHSKFCVSGLQRPSRTYWVHALDFLETGQLPQHLDEYKLSHIWNRDRAVDLACALKGGGGGFGVSKCCQSIFPFSSLAGCECELWCRERGSSDTIVALLAVIALQHFLVGASLYMHCLDRRQQLISKFFFLNKEKINNPPQNTEIS